mmetsp:Transcript_25865/g.60246  ORF Transcript_25865/g.60246 Transcript_25865/m.60246 type:complete len:218 (+) Transcript_25865:628-1281(+)
MATCAKALASMSTARNVLACAAKASWKGESAGSAPALLLGGRPGSTTCWTNHVGKSVSSQSNIMMVLSGPMSLGPTPPPGPRLSQGTVAGGCGAAGNKPLSAQNSSAMISRTLRAMPSPRDRGCVGFHAASCWPNSARYATAISDTRNVFRSRCSKANSSKEGEDGGALTSESELLLLPMHHSGSASSSRSPQEPLRLLLLSCGPAISRPASMSVGA